MGCTKHEYREACPADARAYVMQIPESKVMVTLPQQAVPVLSK